jgi:polysaccharide chain length determinant protein (PEP-CTERM system associated)
MASFRVRQPAEYVKILWRRRFYMFVPFLLVSATLCYAIYKLPNIYESTSLIIVDPPKVSSKFVEQPVTVDISARLSTIRQTVTSRTSLQTLIERYDLYKKLRSQKAPNEQVIGAMQDNIKVDIKNMGSGYNAFTITFYDQNPEVVQAVTSELASLFSNENIQRTKNDAANTVTHLENELQRVKEQLDGIISQRTKYIIQNPSVMQGQMQSIVGQMTSMSQQMLAQQTQIGSLQNTIASYQQMLQMAQARANEEPLIETDGGPAESALRVKRADLEATLQNLKGIYTEKHPDVKTAQLQLEKINNELDELEKKAEEKKNRIKKARKDDNQTAVLQIQIDTAKRDLVRRQTEMEKMNVEYASLQAQLRSIPPLSAEMERIERDYKTLEKQHDELLLRKQQAVFGQRLIDDFNGETFRVQDPANLPEAPVFPRRGLLYPLSLVLGFLSGLAVALAFEARYLFTIRDAKDVEHYTKLPLLVTVPEIMTEHEEQRRRLLAIATAVAVVVGLVPAVLALVRVLEYSRVLSLFTGGGAY